MTGDNILQHPWSRSGDAKQSRGLLLELLVFGLQTKTQGTRQMVHVKPTKFFKKHAGQRWHRFGKAH